MCCSKCGNNVSSKDLSCSHCGKYLNRKNNLNLDSKITILECFKNFFIKGFDGDGVSTPKEFYVIFGFQILYIAVLTLLKQYGILTFINILLFFPHLSLSVRRLHDINLSGGFVVLYGYTLCSYMFYHFVSDEYIQFLLLFSSLATLLVHLVLMTRETNPNSKWNPLNGYR